MHPYLAPVALIMSRWLGREGMHGGGVVAGGGVWAVLGHKTAGKSTMLAWMALERSGRVQRRRPRDRRRHGARRAALDRPAREAARRLGAGSRSAASAPARAGACRSARSRPELPLRGWITLEWGDEIAIRELRGAERLAALLPHRGVRLAPTEPGALLRLSGLPHLRLVRPRRWESLPDVIERLVDAITG